MAWLTWLGNALVSLFRTSISHLVAYWVGKKEGRKDAELEQARLDNEALAHALDARESVDDSPDGMLNDPYNRDRIRKS